MTRMKQFSHPWRRERGATLVIGMIMLVLLTLFVIAAVNMSTINLRVMGNTQARNESIAAAQQAIEQVVTTDFPKNPVASTITVDVTGDGTSDYSVAIAVPACLNSIPIKVTELDATDVDERRPVLRQHCRHVHRRRRQRRHRRRRQFVLLEHAVGRAGDGDRPDRLELGDGRPPGRRATRRHRRRHLLNHDEIKHAAASAVAKGSSAMKTTFDPNTSGDPSDAPRWRSPSARAEDIDIFGGVGGSGRAEHPLRRRQPREQRRDRQPVHLQLRAAVERQDAADGPVCAVHGRSTISTASPRYRAS